MSRIRSIVWPVLLLPVLLLPALADRYVSITSTNPVAGYTNWATAATNVFDAVAVATNGETVWVTNGTYVLTNQVEIVNAITFRSVNGQSATVLNGNYSSTTNRCLFITNANSIVDGFTLTNGYAETGGGVLISNGLMRNCLITGNTGSNGAGVIMYGGVLSNCTVAGNSVRPSGKGAGVYCSSGGKVMNCLIAENTATNASSRGGGVYIYCIGNNGYIGSCTIAGNDAPAGGGMYLAGTNNFVTNCVIYGNTTTNLYAVDENTNAFFNCCAGFTNFAPAQGNTNSNPLLVSLAAGNYRLSSNSPCIDTGTNHAWMTGAFDLDGNPRIINGIVDMGAYEYEFLGVSPAGFTNSVIRGNTTNSSFTISNNGTNTLYWVSEAANSWIQPVSTNGVLAAWATASVAFTNGTPSLTAGVYTGNAVITATNVALMQYTNTVTMILYVMELERDTTNLSQTVIQGQAGTNQTFNIWNAGGGELSYAVTTNVSWLSVSNVTGVLTGQTDAATNTITVSYLTSGLEAGTYQGAITVTPALGGGSKVVDVTVTVNDRPELGVTPGAIEAAIMQGQSVANRVMTITNTSALGYDLGYVVSADRSWVTFTGTTNGTLSAGGTHAVTVSLATSGFQVGVSNATITVVGTNDAGAAALGSPAIVGVKVEVRGFDLSVSPAQLSHSVVQGYNATTQRFEVWNGGGTNPMNYQITDNVPWLMVSPADGVTTGEHDSVSVSYCTAGLDVGASNATITAVGWDASGIWRTTNYVAVSMAIKPQAVLGCDGVSLGITNRQGQVPVSKSFSVWNDSVTPKGGMNWTVSADASWISVNPALGRSTGDYSAVVMGFDVTGLSPGSYCGIVTVSGVDELSGGAAVQSPLELVVDLVMEGTKGLDFLGDGVAAEVVVYGEKNGWWKIKRLSDGYETNEWFGGEGYQPVPGDYDGDGRVDLAVYRSAGASWYMKALGSDTISELRSWGGVGYEPVPGDFDGDGRADYTLYAEANGMWYVLKSSDGGVLSGQFGGPGYQALSGDFDGDKVTDAALYDTRSGNWYIITVNSVVIAWNFLLGGDGFTPVVGDFDGNGRMDVAAYHEETGLWFAKSVEGDTILWWVPWGAPGYNPVSGDYNGDGVTELTVYQESTGAWFMRTVGGVTFQYGLPWGGPGYKPIGQ